MICWLLEIFDIPFRDPVRIQTWNLLIRSQMLYSIELRGHYQFFPFKTKSFDP